MAARPSRIDPPTERAVRDFLRRIASRYPLAGARLFGSRARGDGDKYSDADLAVLLKGPRGDLMSAGIDMAGVAFDVLLDTDILVSPLPIWEDEWEHPETSSNPRLLENIRREGVAILSTARTPRAWSHGPRRFLRLYAKRSVGSSPRRPIALKGLERFVLRSNRSPPSSRAKRGDPD